MNQYWTSANTEGGKEGLLQKLIARLQTVQELKDAGKTQEEIDTYPNQKKPRYYYDIKNI